MDSQRDSKKTLIFSSVLSLTAFCDHSILASFLLVLYNIVATSHIELFKFKYNLTKIK